MKYLNAEQIQMLRDTEIETEEQIIAELAHLFMEMAPRMLYNMRSLYKAGKMKELSNAAHSLKSSCFGIGANGMAEKCLFIETEGRKTTNHDYEKIIDEIEHEFEFVQDEIINLLGTLEVGRAA